MGRFKKGKKSAKNQKSTPAVDKNGQQDGAAQAKVMYDDGRSIIRENALFDTFYKAQHLIPEEEWDTMLAFLRKDLPASFRLVGCRKEADVVHQILKERYLSKMEDLKIDEETIEPPHQLSWYPNGFGYQMKLTRQIIRKNPLLSQFHNFLITETEMGNISRQETVSMIPPLLLDVHSTSKVFDMCAAPGSKTAQLIEMLHTDSKEDNDVPTGFVLANDFDNKRCYLLVHQSLKRLNSPCCLISNADASSMPNMYITNEEGAMEHLKFDRILCDVPCSGDGTLRKNVSIWKDWSLYHAYNLHKLQVRVARRGLELLAVDGLMVYSTCSLNPAEDEATIACLLEHTEGAVELVDISEKLPTLKRRPGLLTWTIMDKDGNIYTSAAEVPRRAKKQIPDTIFPPSEDRARAMHLERCFRIMPHDQDTGGFFVAVLRKTREFGVGAKQKKEPAEDGEGSRVATERKVESGTTAPPAKKLRYLGYKEDPFVFLTPTEPWWDKVRGYYDIRDEFPHTQMLCRCSDETKKRNVYFVNALVKEIIVNNSEKLKFVNAGLRIFGRTEEKDTQCHFRLAQEGLQIIMPYIHRRVIALATEEDLTKLLLSPNVLLAELSPETQKIAGDIDEGSVAILFRKLDQVFNVSAWRGKVSIAAYVTKENRVHFLRLLGQDTTQLEDEMIRTRKSSARKPNETKAENGGNE